jgi:outer membrane immunogenic protein
MNKIWLVGAALVATLAGGSAYAADLPMAPYDKAPPPSPLAVPGFTWTGCYVGIEGGGSVGSSQQFAVSPPNPANNGLPLDNKFNVDGGLVGGTVGCNYQIGYLVTGLENDLSWTNFTGSAPDIPPFSAVARSTTRERWWLDTLRGRLGFAWDRFFFYGTGGVAFADEGVNVCGADGCVANADARAGWTAGGGLEWAAWTGAYGTLSLKVEYLYVDMGTGRFISPSVTFPGGATINTRDVKLTDNIFRAGANWKFNWP